MASLSLIPPIKAAKLNLLYRQHHKKQGKNKEKQS